MSSPESLQEQGNSNCDGQSMPSLSYPNGFGVTFPILKHPLSIFDLHFLQELLPVLA